MATSLDQLYQQLEAAVADLPLATEPADIVPGDGDPQAHIMLIGEAPGYHESVQRRPFVGRSGKLLRQVLAEVGFPPETVFISNIVKVRPPENRDPLPAEIAAYKPYLDQEIEIIDPKVIVTLGRFSMAKFLPDVKISQVHGRLHKVKWNDQTRYILPMYHPAAGLRNGAVKQAFIADFQKLTKILEWIDQHQTDTDLVETVTEVLG